MSNIRVLVTDMQHNLEDHLRSFQEFAHNLNTDERINDTYRQHICSIIKQLDNSIFSAYKTIVDLRAYLDFSLLPNDSQVRVDPFQPPQQYQQHPFRPPVNR